MDKKKTTEDINSIEARKLLDFYIDLMENSKHLLKYYLSENVVLHWFGRTVKGQKQVATFMNTNIHLMKHGFNKEALTISKIGFRESHLLQTLWFPRLTLMFTPIKQPHASSSARCNISRLNLNKSRTKNEVSPSLCSRNLSESPSKRQRINQLDVTSPNLLQGAENEMTNSRIRYLKAEGYIVFHQPVTTSHNKLETETKWQRSCKIHIAYDFINDINDSSFYLIIYEGNNNCRRNLFKDFKEQEPDN